MGPLIGLIAVLVVLVVLFVSIYNGLIRLRNQVDNAWSRPASSFRNT